MNPQLQIADLCILWNWEYDADFVRLLEASCALLSLTVVQVTPNNLNDRLSALSNQQLRFQAFFDRASEDDNQFMPFVQWAIEHRTFYINHHKQAAHSWNKAAMHYELIQAGLYTPYTTILSSYREQPDISGVDLTPLGTPFIVKPVQGSGGEGVVLNVTDLEQVQLLRQKHPARRYLLQTWIVPRKLDVHPAWFRVLYCRERVYPCWWNPETHLYAPLTTDEADHYGLNPLHSITLTIARLSGLDLFSTEIAYTADNLFVVVDYVNDQPDLRRQSDTEDGVPDFIVQDIAERLSRLVADRIQTGAAEFKIY
jgi:hypothetical protein